MRSHGASLARCQCGVYRAIDVVGRGGAPTRFSFWFLGGINDTAVGGNPERATGVGLLGRNAHLSAAAQRGDARQRRWPSRRRLGWRCFILFSFLLVTLREEACRRVTALHSCAARLRRAAESVVVGAGRGRSWCGCAWFSTPREVLRRVSSATTTTANLGVYHKQIDQSSRCMEGFDPPQQDSIDPTFCCGLTLAHIFGSH